MTALVLLLTFAAASLAVLYAYKQGYNHGCAYGKRLINGYTARLRDRSEDQTGADRP